MILKLDIFKSKSRQIIFSSNGFIFCLQTSVNPLESDDEYLKSVFANDFLEEYCDIKKHEHISVFSLPSPREFYLYSNV